MTVDINRTLTFIGKDPNWSIKLLIGAGLSMVPVVHLLASGYAINMFRNVLAGKEDSDVLPEWSDLGDHFVKGLMITLIYLGYMLVPTVMMGVALTPMIASFFSDRPPVLVMGLLGTLFLVAAATILGLILFVLALEGGALYAETGSFGEAFRISEIIRRIRVAPLDFLVALGILSVGCMTASSLAGFVPFFGTLVAVMLGFPVQLMFWHAMGTTARCNFLDRPGLDC
ncbi:MAG: DUF4013 domain-containing protein [Candidatus Xenobium sp.]|jgi:hypothetical protein|nr:DUF4013 domain-containing protein [Burkholderiales bacterium]